MITDFNGVVVWVDVTFTELTGYAADEIVGQNAELLEQSANAAHPLHDTLHHVILSGEPWIGESVGRRKNGEFYDNQRTITPIRDRSNKVDSGRHCRIWINPRREQVRMDHASRGQMLQSPSGVPGVIVAAVFGGGDALPPRAAPFGPLRGKT